jgi:hypothetical protein
VKLAPLNIYDELVAIGVLAANANLGEAA